MFILNCVINEIDFRVIWYDFYTHALHMTYETHLNDYGMSTCQFFMSNATGTNYFTKVLQNIDVANLLLVLI